MTPQRQPNLPTAAQLREALAEVLAGLEPCELNRHRNPFLGAFSSEIIDCVAQDSVLMSIFAKYGSAGTHTGHGYWGGVDRESWVYRHLLPHVSLRTPKHYSSHVHSGSGETWLFIENLTGSRRLNHSADMKERLRDAVRWLARFHSATEPLVHNHVAVESLPHYDSDYFRGWAARTREFASPLSHEYPWLGEVLTVAEGELPLLDHGQLCVVHGEYYPANVLVHDGHICPVDWQSAAVGRGEIDLASILDGWESSDVYQALISEYCQVRWPGGGCPADFGSAFRRARVYWPLRWLGDTPEATLWPRRRAHFGQLHAAVSAAGGVS